MIEYRTERVDPRYEDNIVQTLAVFGWSLVSSQEVYNENTELVGVEVKTYGDGFIGGFMSGFTGSDGSINVKQRKNVTNFTVLKFVRDTNIPNYARLKELNEEFERKLGVPEPRKPVKRTAITVVGTVLILISIILAIVESNSAELWEILVCVLFPLIMGTVTVLGWVFYKRKLAEYNIVQNRLNEIYYEAQELAG